MKVIFRFPRGFTKTEEWNDDKQLSQYHRAMKPHRVELAETIKYSYQPLPYWTFVLLRSWIDENDQKVALYEVIE